MKFLVLIALVGMAAAAAIEEKKEKKDDDKQRALQWPLPDPTSEGDLMLHGDEIYDRVEELHKQKNLDNDVDKATLAHGRQFLKRVQEYLEKTSDFKVNPVLCRDSRQLNGTENRWEIDIQKKQDEDKDHDKRQKDAPVEEKKAEKADDAALHRNSTTNETIAADSPLPVSSTTVKPSPVEPVQDKSFQEKRREFYRQVGENFAKLLVRQQRKEQLSQDETEYLARWVSDEAVHYGSVAIYCHEGENIPQIKKQLTAFLEEKQ